MHYAIFLCFICIFYSFTISVDILRFQKYHTFITFDVTQKEVYTMEGTMKQRQGLTMSAKATGKSERFRFLHRDLGRR